MITTTPEVPVRPEVDTPASVADAPPTLVARGPLSDAVLRELSSEADNLTHLGLARMAADGTDGILTDDDIQFALFVLYSSFYGSLEQLSPEAEWKPSLIETKGILEYYSVPGRAPPASWRCGTARRRRDAD